MQMTFSDYELRDFSRVIGVDPLLRGIMFICALLPCATGCIPKAVLWLNDSSGVVFSDKDGSRLVHYDLKKKASRVICSHTDTRTPWPAISADGKQIAVASERVKSLTGTKKYLVQQQVLIYDLQGTLVHKSSVQEHTEDNSGGGPPDEPLRETGLNWSGPPEKILMKGFIYDITKDAWVSTDGVWVWPFFNMPVGGDRKGFLGIGGSGDLKFVDWDGWVADIEGEHSRRSNEVLGFRWEGGTAFITSRDGITEVDTVQRRTTFKKLENAVPYPNGSLEAVYRFPDKQTQLCLVKRESPSLRVIELHSLDQRKRRVLFTVDDKASVSGLFPSPCGKYVAVRINEENIRGRILIYDGDGQPLADVICED